MTLKKWKSFKIFLIWFKIQIVSFLYDTPHWKIGIRKTRIKSINIQTICILYDRVNEFIQPEGNNAFAPTPFYQFTVENVTNMEHSRFNKNNFIEHKWYVI